MLSRAIKNGCTVSCTRTMAKLMKYSANPNTICIKKFSTSQSQSRTEYTKHLESLHDIGIQFGQPTQFTHSHLLKPNELTIGLIPTEFADRRRKLMEKIVKHCVDNKKPLRNMVIIPAAQKKYMTGKIPYFFRQNTDFLYLSGCLEPDTVLVLWTDDRAQAKSALFLRPKNEHDELWDGPRTGHEHGADFFGVDESYRLFEMPKFIAKFVNQSESFNIWYDNVDEIQSNVTTMLRSLLSSMQKIESPMQFLHELRVIKSPAEIELMRKTCQIASEAINSTMQHTKPGDSEHMINARVDFYCRMMGAQYLAYPPVVAAGTNANIIHYINNTQVAKNGDLVLMDAGCEYGGYSSDITRTWPINGNFTKSQEILYEIVHFTQRGIHLAAENAKTFALDDLFELMCSLLGKYLQDIVKADKLHEMGSQRQIGFRFCPHHVSHYLGMDIHDTPLIKRSSPVEPGMVFTIEPGIYIPFNCKEVHEEFRGLGIRIEDDVLCTENHGLENLTKDCLKYVHELKKSE